MAAAEIVVIRFYNRSAKDVSLTCGVVEAVGAGTRRGFASFAELTAILREFHQARPQPALVLVRASGADHRQRKKESS